MPVFTSLYPQTKHRGCPALGRADVSVPCCRWHLLCWCLSRVFSPRVSPAREVEEAELTVQPLQDFTLTHDYIFTSLSGLMLDAASWYRTKETLFIWFLGNEWLTHALIVHNNYKENQTSPSHVKQIPVVDAFIKAVIATHWKVIEDVQTN